MAASFLQSKRERIRARNTQDGSCDLSETQYCEWYLIISVVFYLLEAASHNDLSLLFTDLLRKKEIGLKDTHSNLPRLER